MNVRKSVALALLALACLSALAGCTSATRKWEDFTQYMHDEVAHW